MQKIEKPWGHEVIIEQNENYVLKELYMKKGNCCSLQYHEFKKETFYLVKGKLKFTSGSDINSLKEEIINPGESLTIDPLVIHRMEAIEDSLYLEASTNFLDDVIRIKDNYGRI